MPKHSITVVAASTVLHDALAMTLHTTLVNTPDVESVLIFSDRALPGFPDYIPLKTPFDRADYNLFVLKHLWPFVSTSHALIIQPDSMAVCADLWSQDFYDYDYIGAVTENAAIYNGGFSLRSRRLLEALQDPTIREVRYVDEQQQTRVMCEDNVITNLFGGYLREIHGIRLCDRDTAGRFGQEWYVSHDRTFGFHGAHNALRYWDHDQAARYINMVYEHSDKLPLYQRLLDDALLLGTDKAITRLMTTFKIGLDQPGHYI